MRKIPSKSNTLTKYEVLEKIAVDRKGPFKIKTPFKQVEFSLFSDKASHYMHAMLGKSKDTMLDALQQGYTMTIGVTIPNQSQRWKIVQSDEAMIAKDSIIKKWLKERAIQVHLHDSWNGQIERDIQTILEKARTLLVGTENMLSLWEYAVKYAIYTYNRTHAFQSPHMTPYEAVFGTLPGVSNLLPFYTPGVYHLTKEERKEKTRAIKATPCRMEGYVDEG